LRRAEGGAKILGYFVWKITILRQKIIFFSNFMGGVRPPPHHPCNVLSKSKQCYNYSVPGVVFNVEMTFICMQETMRLSQITLHHIDNCLSDTPNSKLLHGWLVLCFTKILGKLMYVQVLGLTHKSFCVYKNQTKKWKSKMKIEEQTKVSLWSFFFSNFIISPFLFLR
jgi:hypothetical protein